MAAVLLALLAGVPPATAAQSTRELRERASDLVYNLDHHEAIRLLRQAIAAEPNDPANHRALASTIWLDILFQRGAVTVDHYLGSFTKIERRREEPARRARRRVQARGREGDRAGGEARRGGAARRAGAVRSRRRRRPPGDVYCIGRRAADGRVPRRAPELRRAGNRSSSSIPNRKEAGLVVGTYRYLVSTLSLPMRLMAYVAGFGGGKDTGLRMIEETAAAGRRKSNGCRVRSRIAVQP